MARGKFYAKNRKADVDIYTILAERKQDQSCSPGRTIPPMPAPKKSSKTAGPMKLEKSTGSVRKTHKGPLLSSVIFYTLFFLGVFVFYTATYFGLQELRNWLYQYEMAQPDTKSQMIFEMLFSDPNWSELYDVAGVQDTVYESKDAFVNYMEKVVGDKKLTYLETSSGLSNDRKYIVRSGEKKIAIFTLVNNKQSNFKIEVADWQLGTLEFLIQRNESYFFKKLDGHTVYVNDVPLDDSFTIQISTTNAEGYLPEDANSMRLCTQKVSGLIVRPDVRIVDAVGSEMNVVFDESSRTFMEQFNPITMSNVERDLAIEAVKTYALYMIRQANKGDIEKYFLRGSDAYNSITETELGFVQAAASWEFVNEAVTNYCRYSDNYFSVRVSITLNQYRSSGSVKENTIEQSLFFEKQANGKWLCYTMTAVDVSKSVEKVRLTFMNEDVVLSSDFYDSGLKVLTSPLVIAPEGKVFCGWMVESKNEKNQLIMSLVFQPDNNGVITIPANSDIEPMTLYAYFEKIK